MGQEICDGQTFKWMVAAGLAWLEQHREQVNALNVFPVPDGDTGTNMWLTLQKAYDAVKQDDETHVGLVSYRVARGALQGARGNSGVILSQLFKGFADALHEHETFDVPLLVQACEDAVDAAYKAVMQPTEGTILTVARQAMRAVDGYRGTDLHEAVQVMLAAATVALSETPEQLPILKRAGVVDSGGQGLVFILEGIMRMLKGEPVYLPEQSERERGTIQDALAPDDEAGYGYDVQFLMYGQDMDVDSVRQAIGAMGWSTLVVGDSTLIKVHVHVHNPGEPLNYAIQTGASIDDVVVENMQRQYEHYMLNRGEQAQMVEGVAVITVAMGAGLRDLFYNDLRAAYVVSGGQTMNPDAEAFVTAIKSIPNEHIVILPNNKNIIMAAQQAATLLDGRSIVVVPSQSIPQGISAMVASLDMRASMSLADVVDVMQEGLSHVITCEVTTATRDARIDDVTVTAGQFIGLVDHSLVTAVATIEEAVEDVLQKAGADEHELITLYYGAHQQQSDVQQLVERLSKRFSEQSFEIISGGQPLYPYIISIE